MTNEYFNHMVEVMRGRPLDETSALKIKQAAREIFLARGYDGATMQTIADFAGFNKAQLHYYYRSKDALFKLIFQEEAQSLFDQLSPFLLTDSLSLQDKILAWIDKAGTFFRTYPRIPLFLLNEVHRNPQMVQSFITEIRIPELAKALVSTDSTIRVELVASLMVTSMSLLVYPLLARPLFRFLLPLDDNEWGRIVEAQVELAKRTVRAALAD